jgi:hypothetical protein
MPRMRSSLALSLSLVTAMVVLQGRPLLAAEITPVPLRYSLTPGQTNAYSLDLEVQGEAGREAIGGTFTVSTRAVATNLVALTFRGQLRLKPLANRGPMMPFRPGSSMSLSSYIYGSQYEARELIIDEHGQIVRQAGDLALPIPLGQLMASLVQPLPAEATAGWETEKDVFVLDEPLLQGPGTAFLNPPGGFGYLGHYPGRLPQGVLAVRQKTKIKVKEVTPTAVTLQKTLSLDSPLLTGAEPRVSASGEGQMVLDREKGLPTLVELECKCVVATEESSRRSVVSLRWQLLEGAEREKALAPPLPTPSLETKFTPEEVAKLEERLNSTVLAERQAAARELSSGRLGAASAALLAQIASLASDPDDSVRRAALTMLANHGTRDHVPLLIKAINDPDASLRTTVVKGLGRLKDPHAIEPLVNLLATGQSDQNYYRPPRDNATSEALAHMGTAAEPAVLALLKEKNIDTRIQACNILKQIGTKKSLGPLKDQTLNPSKELGEAAAEACRSIQAREAN